MYAIDTEEPPAYTALVPMKLNEREGSEGAFDMQDLRSASPTDIRQKDSF
jgi:hypothetical protein